MKENQTKSLQTIIIKIKMEQQKKKQLFTFLYILLIVVVITTCIIGMLWIKSESAMCMLDPIKYYSEKAGEMCFCNKLGWGFN